MLMIAARMKGGVGAKVPIGQRHFLMAPPLIDSFHARAGSSVSSVVSSVSTLPSRPMQSPSFSCVGAELSNPIPSEPKGETSHDEASSAMCIVLRQIRM